MSSVINQIEQLLKAHRGNTNLKRAGEKIAFTEDNVREWIKCKDDPIYFINTYCKIISLDKGLIDFNTFSYQERSIRAMHENRNTIHMFGRQHGKCVCINTRVRLKQKSSGKIFEITIGQLYEYEKFKQLDQNSAMLFLQDRISGTL